MNNIITIVTPSFNQCDFIEQTIKSVLDQVGDFYVDYIIADGGSSDGSVGVIKKYDLLLKNGEYSFRCKGVNLRWWSEKDDGQTSSLNIGFKMAKGDICAWINSDDWYEPGAFQSILDEYKKNPEVDLVYGNCFEVFESGKIKKGEALQGDFKKNLEEGCLISQPATFFKREALRRVGYLDESFDYCMDFDLWMKIMKNGKALFVDRDLAYFRVWPGSKTYNHIDKFRKEEDRIRKKYGGSAFNPGSVHRIRQNLWVLNFLKKKFPIFFKFGKKTVYKLINFFGR